MNKEAQTIAFTVCSNNFLAQARTMLRSLYNHHPEFKTFLFLVDVPNPAIDYSYFEPAELVVVDEKVVPIYDDLLDRYTIIELNTAVRPYIFTYLHTKYPAVSKIYYIDPDTFIYDKLDAADRILDTDEIVITPHFLSPLPIDGKVPFENLALNYGTYNMGFFGINPGTTNTTDFLNWWTERTSMFGYVDPANGYFTDQIWYNLVPIFFNKVHSLRHPGYNMAAWNLHERSISSYEEDGRIMLNSGYPLVVYHFSSWNAEYPDALSQHYNRYDFSSRPDLVKLYKDYYAALIGNKLETFRKFECALPYNKKIIKRSPIKKLLSPGVAVMRNIWNRI